MLKSRSRVSLCILSSLWPASEREERMKPQAGACSAELILNYLWSSDESSSDATTPQTQRGAVEGCRVQRMYSCIAVEGCRGL